jgi:hypothetical protein
MVYHNPATLTGMDNVTGRTNGLLPVDTLKQAVLDYCIDHPYRKYYEWGTAKEYRPDDSIPPEFKGAFLLNLPLADIPGADQLIACRNAAEALLARGVVSETCAKYELYNGANDFSVRFERCHE